MTQLLLANPSRLANLTHMNITETTLAKLAAKAEKAKYPHLRKFLLEHIEVARRSRWIVAYCSSNRGKREYYIVKTACQIGVSGTALARFSTRPEAQTLCEVHNSNLK